LRREVKLAIGDAHVRAKERVENKIEIIFVILYFIAMFILYEIMRVRGALICSNQFFVPFVAFFQLFLFRNKSVRLKKMLFPDLQFLQILI